MTLSGNSILWQTSPIARLLVRFLRWWGGELAALVPERVRVWWCRGGQAVMLNFEGERAEFARWVAGQRESVFAVDLDRAAPASQGGELVQQLAREVGAGFRLMLSLPPSLTLRRKLTLPVATEENLAQTLAFELDRYTPFKPDEVHFDFRICSRDASRQTIEVDLAVVRRADVDRLTGDVSSWGLPIRGLAFDGEVLGGNPANGVGMAEPGPHRRGTLWRIALAVLAVLLLAALLAIPVWQKRTAAIALLAPLAEARQAARETDALRDRLNRLVGEHNALPDRKWASPSLLQILEELTLRLKDDTFVLNFSFDGKAVVLQGESASAAELVEVLEASPLFINVVFKSPLTKLQGGTHDRFHIGLEISPEGMLKPPADTATP